MSNTYEDIEERVEKMIKLQKQLREMAQDMADSHLEFDDLGTVEDLIFAHVDNEGLDCHQSQSQIIEQLYNMKLDYASKL